MSSRNARALAIGLTVTAWLVFLLRMPPLLAGDAVEYVSVSEAWYLRWPHPEVFTWACVLISLVCLNNRRYVLAAAAAALGAMQNPPVGWSTALRKRRRFNPERLPSSSPSASARSSGAG